MKVAIIPHGDDEVIGLYSVLDQIDLFLYVQRDYREEGMRSRKYLHLSERPKLTEADTIYLPSSFDYHPLHREVRRIGLGLPGKKMFFSIEMNTPWLQEELDPGAKRNLLQHWYPGEYGTISRNDKYFLFKSIESFDELIWATVQFQREFFHCWPEAPNEVAFLRFEHRHLFYFKVSIQQFGDDRDLEYFILSRKVQQWVDTQQWGKNTSCEMFALAVKRWLECEYRNRLVRVSVFEDRENGVVIE